MQFLISMCWFGSFALRGRAVASFRVDVSDEIVGLPGEESFFGHDFRLKGLAPRDGAKAAHLVLTLDDRDPDVAALGVNVGPLIRLVHPFYYSQGDSFYYRHVNENQLEFFKEPYRYNRNGFLHGIPVCVWVT